MGHLDGAQDALISIQNAPDGAGRGRQAAAQGVGFFHFVEIILDFCSTLTTEYPSS
jgi:hypothetical protein